MDDDTRVEFAITIDNGRNWVRASEPYIVLNVEGFDDDSCIPVEVTISQGASLPVPSDSTLLLIAASLLLTLVAFLH